MARWTWPPSWKLVVATPHVELATDTSRRIIPPVIPLPDVVFNLQRLAMLLHAVETRDASKLAAALRDRAHQPYREPIVPVLRRALALRHPDVLGVCLSGAGPSVAAVAKRNLPGVKRTLAAAYRADNIPCTVRVLDVHQPSTRSRGRS